jgi:hypothetical protein
MSTDELKPLPPRDYSKQFNVPAPVPWVEGNQVLHIKSTNKPYTKNPKAVEFVKTYLVGAKPLEADSLVLKYASDAVNQDGLFLEMGVGMGRTINFVAGLNPTKIIHGFDSFEGLSEDWDKGDEDWGKGDRVVPKGTFALKDPNFTPDVYRNVRIYKGFFKDVLPKFKTQILRDQIIAFLHIDCDSYTPTSEIFNLLATHIKPGTVLVFDELYNYSKYAEHEWKAFHEFLTKTGYQFEPLAYNINNEQVAVRIK